MPHPTKARLALWTAVSAVAVGASGASCGTPPPEDGTVAGVGESRSAIINGQPSGPEDNFAVAVQASNGDFCSGILVDPLIVLSAAHCFANVSYLSDKDIADCQLGSSPSQGATILVGDTESTAQLVNVKAVYTDPTALSCQHDLAALILEKPVTSVKPAPILLDSIVKKGTTVTLYGWGQIATHPDAGAALDVTVTPMQRQKATGKILNDITAAGSYGVDGMSFPFPSGFFIATNQILACYGDSGGPLVDESGNLVGTLGGVVSVTGLRDFVCGTASLSYGPVPGNSTKFIERVFQSIGKMPHRAGEPPPSDLGGSCNVDNQCNSNYCVQIGGQGTCSRVCKKDGDCTPTVEGQTLSCTEVSAPQGSHEGQSICLAKIPAPTPKGCSTTTLKSPPSAAAAGSVSLIGAVALLSRRRRTRKEARDARR